MEFKQQLRRPLLTAILFSVGRSRKQVTQIEARFPSAHPREISQRLIDGKKIRAGAVGGMTGVFGIASIPADWLAMLWLQVELLVEIATVYRVNLKSEPARVELLDLFGHANGIGPVERISPLLAARLASRLLRAGKLSFVSRAVPVVAAPLAAYLNHRHIQLIGETAIKHYEGFHRARAKLSAKL